MDQSELTRQIHRVAMTLRAATDAERDDLGRVRHLLASFLARGGQPAGAPDSPAAFFEAALAEATPTVTDEARREAEALAAKGLAGALPKEVAAAADFELVRRELPLRSSLAPLSIPAQAAGRKVERSFGPFIDASGRSFWFDLFLQVRQVALVVGPDPRPVLVLPIRGLLAATTEFRLPAGSIWIRSRLLAGGAPDHGYSGLRIKGGVVRLGAMPTVAGITLQLPPGTPVTLEIETDPVAAPAGGGVGEEGRAARSDTPDMARFLFAAAGASLDQSDGARLTAYGTGIELEHAPGAGRFEPRLNRVLLPFAPKSAEFRIRNARSELFQPTRLAPILGAAWALPVAVADPATLGEAAGTGGLVLDLGAGLGANWRGLPGTLPVRLGEALLITEPGLLALVTAGTAAPGVTQTLALWQEAGKPRSRSEIVLGYTDTTPITFLSQAGAGEGLLLTPSLEASIDRPVGTDGQRIAFRTPRAQVAFTQDAAGFQARILAGFDPTVPPVPPPSSLALSNALLQLAGPSLLGIFGTLADPGSFRNGTLGLLFGVAGLLPTLRDPYVANYLPLGRGRRIAGAAASALVARLLARVDWAGPAEPKLSLTLLSTAAQGAQRTLAPSAVPVGNPDPKPALGLVARPRQGQDTTPRSLPGMLALANGGPGRAAEEDRLAGLRLRALFEETAGATRESLLLVDVSSNIDQLGVGFGINLRDQREEGAAFPLRILGLDLAARVRNLRIVLLPQFQWEPVQTLQNPLVGPFPSPLASADDGGASVLGSNSVTLVPIAPERVAGTLLDEFATQPVGGLFTLPFGMKAAASFRAQAPGTAQWTVLALNRPTTPDARFTGGIQIMARAEPDRGPQIESPSFPGAAWQTRNGVDPGSGIPLGVSVLAAEIGNPGVEAFFNNEMGPASPMRRVPVTRIDFSGYGASTFSNWRNPNVVAQVSQARFEATVGRTAYEVVQVASVLYPWAVLVVRTITLERRKEGYVQRWDSGWVATSPGEFRYPQPDPAAPRPADWTAIETHPGMVRGIRNVRRIRETGRVVQRVFPPEGVRPEITVELLEVRFDGDVIVEGAVSGTGTDGLVPSIDQLGYVQRLPTGYPLLPDHLAAILEQEGPPGGGVDCVAEIGGAQQRIQVARVDVAPARPPGAGTPHFAAAARGALFLPGDGQWSVMRRDGAVGDPRPVDPLTGVPVVRQGTAGGIGISPFYRIAAPEDVLREAAPEAEFGLVQGSDGHRVLFPRPRLRQGIPALSSTEQPLLADTYTLSIGTGAFPRAATCFVGATPWTLAIGGDGRFALSPATTMPFVAPPGVADRRLVDAGAFSIRTRYTGQTTFTLDPAQPVSWAVKTTGITTTMDLGPFEELMGINHDFRVAADAAPGFLRPEMVYAPFLQPVVEIVRVLAELLGLDNPLQILPSQGSFKFKASLNLPIENSRAPDGYIDFGGMEIKGKLQLGIASAPVWSGFLKIELGAKVPILPPIYGGGEIKVGLEGTEVSGQTVTIDLRWTASIGKSLGPITVKASFFFGIQVVVQTAGGWQIGLLVGVSGTADISIVKITVKIELLAAIKRLPPPNTKAEALGRAKFAAEVSVCWFLTISVEYSLEYSEQIDI